MVDTATTGNTAISISTDTTLGNAGPVAVAGPEGSVPVQTINKETLRQLGAHYARTFTRYSQERFFCEQRWIRSLRQYLGVYDPEVERQMPVNQSRAYPRLTRVKCVSMLSRIMNLMFPGNEKNWELQASPSAEMSPEDVAKAVQDLLAKMTEANGGQPPEGLGMEVIDRAVQELADSQAKQLSALIDDQLQELGGDQSADFVRLNRAVCDSGIKYGLGVLRGPFIRQVQKTGWVKQENGQFAPQTRTVYKPQYEFLPVWDFYPDMSAKVLNAKGSGYFIRLVLTRSALRQLGNRPDFFTEEVKDCIRMIPAGNYKARTFENDLKQMGLSSETPNSTHGGEGREKYEIVIWNGPVSAHKLRECGAAVPDSMMADDIDAEIWLVDNRIIKATINPWRKMGVDVKTIHTFLFDEDDTSPIGNGLPQIVRDSQLSVCATVRMALDNASVVCGPNLEVNTTLLRTDQDLTSIQPRKIWYREDEGVSAQFPAVREINIQAHLPELQSLTKMFMEFAEIETFIGPNTGGDMSKTPSEPMRTAAGASALRGDAALPFKDIVRNYDSFTQSVIQSLVQFNHKFNPDLAPPGDYNVIARGATSLIAKEVRGMQIDQLSQTLTDDERDHIDERKFMEAKFASRDLEGMLVSPAQAADNKAARAKVASEQADLANQVTQATIRETLSQAFKNITQGQKNTAAADATTAKQALDILERGLTEGAPDGGTNQPAKTA